LIGVLNAGWNDAIPLLKSN